MPHLTLKLFSVINNDADLKGTRELEGESPGNTLGFLLDFLIEAKKIIFYLKKHLNIWKKQIFMEK